jgi:hypothetical protein
MKVNGSKKLALYLNQVKELKHTFLGILVTS